MYFYVHHKMFPERSKKETSTKELVLDTSLRNSADGNKGHDIVEEIIESFGKCNWLSIAKGYGFIPTEVGYEGENNIFVYQMLQCCENGHHAKECKAPHLPKRCHNCKSVEQLVSCCPSKSDFQRNKSGNNQHVNCLQKVIG